MREDVDSCRILVMYFSFLFSGYVGSKSFLEEVLQVVHQLRKANPNLVFGMYLTNYVIFAIVEPEASSSKPD